MREVLESFACRLAAERMTEGELDELDALLGCARQGSAPGTRPYPRSPAS
ncbi:MAG: FCD domain-containing protein [Pseudomonadota bacterium]